LISRNVWYARYATSYEHGTDPIRISRNHRLVRPMIKPKRLADAMRVELLDLDVVSLLEGALL